jgi:tetratricopeptide (TPR) repeat protein
MYFSGLMTLAETASLFTADKEAEKRFVEALTEVATMREKYPNAPELVHLEALFHDHLGSLYLTSDRQEKAREEFNHALQLREAGSATPEGPERMSDMAVSYNKLGNLSLEANDLPGALAYYQRSLDVRRKLCAENPKRLDWARDLSLSLANTAQVLWETGQNQQAVHLDIERLKLAEHLFNEAPTDSNFGHDYANALFNYADFLLNVKDPSMQDWAKALDLARDAVRRSERHDPRLLVLLAQALRLNHLPADAYAAAEEASRLLPPQDKRTDRDKDAAKEIAYELGKSKGAAGKAIRNGSNGRRQNNSL